jgi:hypothetical protein
MKSTIILLTFPEKGRIIIIENEKTRAVAQLERRFCTRRLSRTMTMVRTSINTIQDIVLQNLRTLISENNIPLHRNT